MSAQKIGVGVMGCANIAERMVIPAIQACPSLELRWVASRTEEKARRYGEKFNCAWTTGYGQLLEKEDIDLVYMPLPTGLHLEWGLKTLDAGKHLLLEKSLAVSLSDARLLVAKAREKKRAIQENFMFAFHRQMAAIREVVQSGRLGEIRCLRSSFGFPPFPDAGNIRYSSELGGGALLDAGAYTLKIASLLLGPDLVPDAAHLTFDRQKGVDLFGGAFLHRADGVVVETAFGFDHFYQCNLEIWGTLGKLSADRIFTAGPGVDPPVWLDFQGRSETLEIGPDNHFVNLLSALAERIQTGTFGELYPEIEVQAALLQSVRDMAGQTWR